MRLVRRRALLAGLGLGLAGCGGGGGDRVFAPLRYDYLTPLRLNVASIDYAPLPAAGGLDGEAPIQPASALRQMAQDRLAAGGSSGRILVTIDEARIARGADGLDGAMGLHLDVVSTDGRRVGYAEARVVRHVSRTGELRATLYDMTKQMLDDMNVELEFQLRRSMREYLQTTDPVPPPAAVQQQDLSAPKP